MTNKIKARFTTGVIAMTALMNAHVASAEVLTAQFDFKVVEFNDAGEEVLVARDSVRPGETIEYAMLHENVGEDDLSGLVLAGPIPDGVTLQIGSEASSVAAVFEIQAELEPEIEGLEWASWPAERKVIEADGTVRVEPLPVEEIEAVRWALNDALPGGASAENSYRVIVN